jgi:CRP-like cAMP-binding protein
MEVLASTTGDRATHRVIAQFDRGQTFGEMGLLSGGVRTASLRALEDAALLEIGKADFEHLSPPTLSSRQPSNESVMSAPSAISARAVPFLFHT